MVAVKKSEDNFVFTIIGLHKIWSFKSELTIPAEHIIDVHHYGDSESTSAWFRGIKFPGINIPGLLTAGSFLTMDGTIFYDIANVANAIVIVLNDEHYKRLIIEVEDPSAVTALIKAI